MVDIIVKKKRFVLILNSHSLSDYQMCPQRYEFLAIEQLVPSLTKHYFNTGNAVTLCLEEYYKARMAKTKFDAMAVITSAIKDLPEAVGLMVMQRILYYTRFYANESWIPVAAELGFSKVLYEDDSVVFIYEGRPDLIAFVDKSRTEIIVTDHKHQSRKSELYPFNNQSIGYCWSASTDQFCYNIISFITSGKEKDWFRRPSTKFTKLALDTWREDSIYWYGKIMEDVKFVRSKRCETKYGLCAYHQLCECDGAFPLSDYKRRKFKVQPYESWRDGDTSSHTFLSSDD